MAAVQTVPCRSDGTDPAADVDESSIDRALMRRMAAGDGTALAILLSRYQRRAAAVAIRIVGSRHLAEDVLQDAFAALWLQAGAYDADRGPVATWVLMLVHHKAVDLVRRTSRYLPCGPDVGRWPQPPHRSQAVEDQIVRRAQRIDVRTAVRALPRKQREALWLAYYEGYTQREIAALTGCPLGTVKTRVFNGLRQLRGSLASESAREE